MFSVHIVNSWLTDINILFTVRYTSTNGYKDQLLKLAQLKSHGRNLTAKDVTMATSRMSSLMMHVERSVRAAKKSKMSIDNFATFGDFFLQIPEAIINEMMKKHKFEEEVFFSLCGTICEAEVGEVGVHFYIV